MLHTSPLLQDTGILVLFVEVLTVGISVVSVVFLGHDSLNVLSPTHLAKLGQ